MGEPARQWDLPAYAKQRIRIKARSLVGHYWLTWADLPDIEQRLALKVWQGLLGYNPAKGDIEAFVYWLVEKAAATLVEAEVSGKRQADRAVWSIDRPIYGPDGRTTTAAAVTEAADAGRRQGLAAEHFTVACDRAMDFGTFVDGLDSDLRDLCERLLAGQNFTDIHNETGVARGTLYERRDELERLMKEAGLREYLPSSGASGRLPVDGQ